MGRAGARRGHRVGRLLGRGFGLVLICLLAALLVAGAIGGTIGLLVDRAGRFVSASGPGSVPDLSSVSRDLSQPSVVLAGDGSVIGRFQPEELHVPLAPNQIPDTVATAVVAAEDERFWDHPGFDLRAMGRALLRDVARGAVLQGGSTITQQLVKNSFTGADRTLARKVEEVQMAWLVERHYDKQEILAAYLNSVFFGEGAVGIEAAAGTYLRKPASDLSLGEAALLVGIIPSPTTTNPRRDATAAETRRQAVLDRVAESGLVGDAEIAAARSERPTVHPRRPGVERHPYFLDYVRRWLVDLAGVPPAELRRGGLTIETTLDPALQEAALDSVRTRLPAPSDPTAAVAVVSPESGEVLSLIGGRDWASDQVNLALGRLGGGSGRQPGSAFKPFVLALAYERGASPDDLIEAPAEYELDRGHVVRNYSRRGYGWMTLDEATRWSINTAYTGLALSLGIDQVADLARRMGLSAIPDPGAVGPSLAIGAYEVAPLHMASAYGAFAADGRRVDPRPVRRILSPQGEVVHDWTAPAERPQVVGPSTAHRVTATLQGVVTSGTGAAAAIGRPAAGKTGTSSSYGDAWFVGYTPQLATAVWVGYPDGNRPMHDVGGFADVTGGSLPALIWHDVMTAAHRGLPVVGFDAAPPEPDGATT